MYNINCARTAMYSVFCFEGVDVFGSTFVFEVHRTEVSLGKVFNYAISSTFTEYIIRKVNLFTSFAFFLAGWIIFAMAIFKFSIEN